jgi:ABC-type transporter Mla subunit MlaD
MADDLRPHTIQDVATYRAQVVAWLRHKEAKLRKTARETEGAAADAASFYAAAYHNAADGVANGDPERWTPR